MTEPVELYPFDFGEFRNFESLDAAGQVEQLAAMLSDFGVELTRPWQEPPMAERGGDAVDDRFAAWGSGSQPTILYWVGHGWATVRDAALAHAKSPTQVGTSGIGPKRMAAAIGSWEARAPKTAWLLVIIDACKSARYTELLAAELDNLGGPRRIAILGTSSAASTTLGVFTRELAAALQHTFAGNTTIPLTQLVDELRRTVRGERRVLNLDQDAVLSRLVPPVDGFTGPLDARAELTAIVGDLPEDERRHFLTKAQGGELRGDMLGELSWHFTGRDEERQQLLTRIESGGLVVVTGRAGSGKSAILGDLVVRSRPELERVLIDQGLIDPALDRAPRLDAAVQLTGLDVADVLTRLSGPLGVPPPAPGLPLTAQLDDIAERLARRSDRARIVVDALDEAVAPLQVAAALRRIGASPRVDLVVGTRRSTKEAPDRPDPADRDLLTALGADDEQTVEVRREEQLAFRYVRDRLRPLVDAGTASQDQVTAAARTIARVDQEFLYARLATYELLNRPGLLAEDDLIDRLGPDHRSVFAGAVARLAGAHPEHRPLLTALALAQGRGLPIRDGVWAAVASAVGGSGVAESVIHRLLDEAAPYLALDVEHGQTVYRLAHRTFAEHLTADPHAASRHHAETVARALAELAKLDEDTPANPYWVFHTSAHCAAAGPSAWQQLDRSPALDLLDPDAVARDAMRALFGRGPLPPNIAAGVFARAELSADSPGQRPATRRMARARVTSGVTPAPSTGHPPDRLWWPAWTVTERYPVHAVLTGHTDRVRAVAAVPLPDGRTLLATGSDDQTVRLWDPATGAQIGAPLTGHSSWIAAVAAVPLPDGRTLLATGGADRTVRLWDPTVGAPVGNPLAGHTGGVRAVTASLRGSRTLLVSASDGRTVRLWNPVTHTQVGETLIGHTGAVHAVAAVPLRDGRTLLATGSSDQTVRLWDPSTGTLALGPLMGHAGAVQAVAAVPLSDDRTLLATGSSDQTVRLWDPADGAPVRSLTRRSGPVLAVAAVPLPEGRTLLATCGDDAKVRLWDPSTGAARPPLTGHARRLYAVAAMPLPDGRTLLASAGNDRTVRLWDLATDTRAGPTLGHTDRVRALAAVPLPDGRTLLATGSNDSSVLLWDAANGAPVGEPLTGHAGPVYGVTAVPMPDGRALLATCGADRRGVRLWDPTTGALAGNPLTGPTRPVRALAAVPLPNGRTLLAAAGEDPIVLLLDPASGALATKPITGHTAWVRAVTAVPLPGRRTLLATGGDDHTARLWDPATGAAVGDPLNHTGSVRAVAAIPLSVGRTLLATGSDDHTVRLWDPATGAPIGDLFPGHTGVVQAVAAVPLPDGRTLLATGSDDRTVRLWDLATGTSILTIQVGAPVSGLASVGPARFGVAMQDGLAVITLGGRLLTEP